MFQLTHKFQHRVLPRNRFVRVVILVTLFIFLWTSSIRYSTKVRGNSTGRVSSPDNLEQRQQQGTLRSNSSSSSSSSSAGATTTHRGCVHECEKGVFYVSCSTPRSSSASSSRCDEIKHNFPTIPITSEDGIFPFRRRAPPRFATTSIPPSCTNPYYPRLRHIPWSFASLSSIGGRRSASTSSLLLAVYASNDSVSRSLLETGHWKPKHVEQILDIADASSAMLNLPRPHFIDIGANVGGIALAVASAGYPTIAFELLPSNLALLHMTKCLNAHLNLNFTLLGLGLSDHEHYCSTVSHRQDQGDAIVLCSQEKEAEALKHGYVSRGTSHLRTLDALFPDGLPYPSIVKLDVEGHEPNVIRGAHSALTGDRRPLAIFSEVWKTLDLVSFVWHVRVLGYYALWVEQKMDLRDREAIRHMQEVMPDVQNVLFLRTDVRRRLWEDLLLPKMETSGVDDGIDEPNS
eukprot:PhM_4_TR15118/c0_g1_i1/m.78951